MFSISGRIFSSYNFHLFSVALDDARTHTHTHTRAHEHTLLADDDDDAFKRLASIRFSFNLFVCILHFFIRTMILNSIRAKIIQLYSAASMCLCTAIFHHFKLRKRMPWIQWSVSKFSKVKEWYYLLNWQRHLFFFLFGWHFHFSIFIFEWSICPEEKQATTPWRKKIYILLLAIRGQYLVELWIDV